jgi:hypothetical protein
MIKEKRAQMVNSGKWQDRWEQHPFPNLGKPEKAMCYLTDNQRYDEDHLAWLYKKASLHAIDPSLCRSESDYPCYRGPSAVWRAVRPPLVCIRPLQTDYGWQTVGYLPPVLQFREIGSNKQTKSL